MEQDDFEAVVLAAGDYPTHPLPAGLLCHPRVVCCDGAAAALVAHGIVPWRAVGDGDSIGATHLPCPFERVAEQDTNDLSKAMRLLLRHGLRRVAIVGATGRREDHTLGNISLLVEYMRQGFDVAMYTDYGIFRPARGVQQFGARVGQQVSLFNFTCTRISQRGLMYPLPPLTNWWMGTLNEALSSSFTIDADGEYLVYWAYCEVPS